MNDDMSTPADLADVGTRVDDGHMTHLVGPKTTILRYAEGRFKRTREVPLTYCDFVVVNEKYHVFEGDGAVTCRRCRLYVRTLHKD